MSQKISDTFIEEVRDANDIVDVIGEYVQLKKQGRNYFGLCPFHGEKTPSFSVTEDKQIFHCFGCGKGGNIFTFLMEIEGYTFHEAVVQLAEKSGVSLPEQLTVSKERESEADQDMVSAHEWLTKLYHHLLMYSEEGQDAYQYFKKRGIKDDTLKQFQLGYAPNRSEFTSEFLDKKGFHQQDLVKAGILGRHEDGRLTDHFQGRVMIPIRNHQGKTIGFGGRAIKGQEPKYLNSPESDLFQKGRLLFNFDIAKRDIRKQNEVVLFEGYMDVLSAYQAGVLNGLATLGTSLTKYQSSLLKRYTDTVILCYDRDEAGMEGMYKAALLLREAGCIVKVARLPENMDPDDYIHYYGEQSFKDDVIASSNTFTQFYMQYIKKDYNLNVQGDRLNYIEMIIKHLATIESPVEREYYVQEMENAFNVSKETLMAEIQSIRNKQQKRKCK